MAGNSAASWAATLLTANLAVAQTPFVKMSDHAVAERMDRGASLDVQGAASSTLRDDTCELLGLARYGQDVPGGGTLGSIAFADGESINSMGRIAFVSRVDGAERNQGVFSAGGDGLVPIVMGCGGGGGSGIPGSGCGDPSPIGGTFSGLFPGTPPAAPPINGAGDILFISDVDGGFSPRGLFLYQADTGDIREVAAVGDASPVGGTFSSIGPGSLNNSRQVVFLAFTGASTDGNLFLWNDGVVSKVVAVGDPAPGGGSFWNIGSERLGYADGTMMPTGPLGAINDLGQISFRGYVTGGESLGGIFLSDGTTHQWYVKHGDPTPMGGTYAGFGAPALNNAGEVAFFSDVFVGSDLTSAWFAGSPGNWRKALAFFDPVDDGQVRGLAYSRNPLTPLNDAGRLLLWATIRTGTVDRERLLISEPDGSLSTVVRQGDPTPFGGPVGIMHPWPSLNNDGQGTLGAQTPGAPGVFNAFMIFQSCTP
jgi:hypothetical protein